MSKVNCVPATYVHTYVCGLVHYVRYIYHKIMYIYVCIYLYFTVMIIRYLSINDINNKYFEICIM